MRERSVHIGEHEFSTFGGRLRWLRDRLPHGRERTWAWIAKQIGRQAVTVREWAGYEEAHLDESSITALSNLFGVERAWLRYGVGAPLIGRTDGSGTTSPPAPAPEADVEFDPLEQVTLSVVDMGGMLPEEVVAEVVRRAVRGVRSGLYGGELMRRVYRWCDAYLGIDGEHVPTAARSSTTG